MLFHNYHFGNDTIGKIRVIVFVNADNPEE